MTEIRTIFPFVVAAVAIALASCTATPREEPDAVVDRNYEVLSEGEFEDAVGSDETVGSVPAGPPPEQQPARFFTVFFDLGSDKLGDDGMAVVEEVAAAWSDDTSKLKLVGHADTTGPKSYNQRLSERRAKSVRDALEELGVQADRMIDGGAGEDDLLVPTGDGVSDRHNRRVTIVVE